MLSQNVTKRFLTPLFNLIYQNPEIAIFLFGFFLLVFFIIVYILLKSYRNRKQRRYEERLKDKSPVSDRSSSRPVPQSEKTSGSQTQKRPVPLKTESKNSKLTNTTDTGKRPTPGSSKEKAAVFPSVTPTVTEILEVPNSKSPKIELERTGNKDMVPPSYSADITPIVAKEPPIEPIKRSESPVEVPDEKASRIDIPGEPEPVKSKGKDSLAPRKKVAPKRSPEVLNKDISENNDDQICFINYLVNDDYLQETPWIYPYVKMPKPNSVVRIPHAKGRLLRGHTEADFQRRVQSAFNRFTVSGNDCIPTSDVTRAYEPDISLIMRENNLNLFIDIEIDEPYAGITRMPLHCLGKDDLRDTYFTDRGWLVIRFSERQITLQSQNCLAFIARIIASVNPAYSVPLNLINISDPAKEPQWTSLQAQKWANMKYREKYLGIERFSPVPTNETNVAVTLTDSDKAAEEAVVPSIIIATSESPAYPINKRNAHVRDKRIKFIQDSHTYLIDGVHARSVTELIDDCFPIFDSDYWANRKAAQMGIRPNDLQKKWRDEADSARNQGTVLHECIEKYYHGVTFEPVSEFKYFQSFQIHHPTLKPYRTEWRVFDEYNLIAGTLDLVVDNGDGSCDIYDWKRSKKVIDPYSKKGIKVDPYGKTGIGAFSSIHDTSYNRYCLQQNVYKLILEKHYGIKVRNMHLVVMHPSLSDYCKVDVIPMRKEAERLVAKHY